MWHVPINHDRLWQLCDQSRTNLQKFHNFQNDKNCIDLHPCSLNRVDHIKNKNKMFPQADLCWSYKKKKKMKPTSRWRRIFLQNIAPTLRVYLTIDPVLPQTSALNSPTHGLSDGRSRSWSRWSFGFAQQLISSLYVLLVRQHQPAIQGRNQAIRCQRVSWGSLL